MDLPYLTRDLEGTGGRLRTVPEDFIVDEIPLYELTGEGEHVWFQVRKRGIDTFEATRRIAAALDENERYFSYAGLKDGRAVTTQWMSTDTADEERIRALDVPKVKILQVRRHVNRIKLGHLRGNRFRITVRATAPNSTGRAAEILDVLVRRGAPNFFGHQRFGARLNSHLCGEAILRRDYDRFVAILIGGRSSLEKDPYLNRARDLFDKGKLEKAFEAMPIRQRAEKKALGALLRFGDAERAYFAIPKRMRQMFLSAFQSHLFNEIVRRRIDTIDRVETGDLAYLHRNGAVFRVEEGDGSPPRCTAFEISPSAPVFGTKSPLAEGEPGRIEREVIDAADVKAEDFDVGGGLAAKGNRRSVRAPVRDAALVGVDESTYRLEFALPRGTYATSIMRELMK
ncbi:MAG: tRNA pseudouridine(13) synthase TruD [Planctomycetota bacterium]